MTDYVRLRNEAKDGERTGGEEQEDDVVDEQKVSLRKVVYYISLIGLSVAALTLVSARVVQ